MADKKINIVLDASMDISKIKTAVGDIQKAFTNVSLPSNIDSKFKSTMKNMTDELAKYDKQLAQGINSAGDFSKLEKSGRIIVGLFENLQDVVKSIGQVGSKDLAKLLPDSLIKNIEKANNSLQDYIRTEKTLTKNIDDQNHKIQTQTNKLKQLEQERDKIKDFKNTDSNYKQLVDEANALEQTYKSALNVAESFKKKYGDSPTSGQKSTITRKNNEAEKIKVQWEQATTAVTEYANTVPTKLKEAERAIKSQQNTINNSQAELQTRLQNQASGLPTAFNELVNQLKQIPEIDLSKYPNDINGIKQAISDLQTAPMKALNAEMQKAAPTITAAEGAFKTFSEGVDKTSNSIGRLVEKEQEIGQLQNRIQYFFGLTNTVLLFRRAVNSAIETVKELDAAMTEMAVVTDKGIGDYWNELPEYTRRANELGLAIKDVYESMTLFYQQGLTTEEAVALSNSTLKMARIAGLDAAEATDRMTNALRGFNMALNETSATNVADVYSKLAAITASDVDEISTAMTKVASIANSAGMTFENTAAFLAQIIETTRESAETAGTALKTVVARFSEVKELYDQGLTSGENDEGEIIDVNKVQTALRTVGISMTDFFQGQEGLDSIFIQLAEKWDTLDTLTQRYIATQAAGSRQQSRFIALMSDYARTQYLVAAANNAAGASNEQYEKTLESLESKLNKLKNAWDQFTMGIANNNLVKFGVDALTTLLNIINKCTSALGDFGGALAKLGLGFTALKTGKVLFNSLFAGLAAASTKDGFSLGAAFGKSFSTGMATEFKGLANILKGSGIKQVEKSFVALSTAQYEAAMASKVLNSGSQELEAVLAKVTLQDTLYKDSLLQTATAMGLNNAETLLLDSLIQQGIPAKTALLAVTHGITQAEIDNAIATGATTKAKVSEWIVDEAKNRTAKVGLGIKAKELIMRGYQLVATKLQTASNVQEAISLVLVKLGASEAAAALAAMAIVIVLVVALIGLLIFGIVKLIKALKNSTPESKLNAAKEATEQATEAANEATEAYNTLKDTLDSIGEATTNLETMTEGTQEWKDAVQELNNQVLDLLDKYPELAAYVKNNNGVLTIDYEVTIDGKTANDVIADYGNRATQAQSAEVAARIKQQKAQDDYNYSALKDKYKAYTYTEDGTQLTNRSLTEDIALKIAQGQLITAEQITTYAQQNGVLINTTEESIEALRAFGQSLLASEAVNEAYYDAMAANATNAAKYIGTDDVKNRAKNYANGDITEDLVKQQTQVINQLNKDDTKTLANTYAQNILGLTLDEYTVDNKGNITYTDENDEEKTVAIADIKTQMAAVEATEELTNKIEDFNQAIGKTTDSFIKHMYDAVEGAKLTANDLKSVGADFKNIDFTTLLAKDDKGAYTDANAQVIKDYYSNIFTDEEITTLYGSWDAFIQYVAESGQIAAQAFSDVYTQYAKMGLKGRIFDAFDLTAETSSKIADSLQTVFDASGTEAAQMAQYYFQSLLGSAEDVGDVADAISEINWTSVDSINTFSDTLETLEIDWDKAKISAEDLEDEMIRLTKATKNVNLTTLVEDIKSLSKIAFDINGNKDNRSFDDTTYTKLIESGIAKVTDFVYNLETGNYEYLGESTSIIVEAIQKQTDELLGENGLKEKIASGEILKNMFETQTVDTTDINSMYNFLTNYLSQAGNNATFSQDKINAIKTAQDTDAMAAIIDELLNDFYNLDTNLKNHNEIQQQSLAIEAQTNSANTNSSLINDYIKNNDAESAKPYEQALIAQAQAAGISSEYIDMYTRAIENNQTALIARESELIADITATYQQAEAYSVDTAVLQAYAEQLMETNEGMSEQTAYDRALNDINLNTGYAELVDNYEDWCGILWDSNDSTKQVNKNSVEYVETMTKLKKAVSQMLNTSVQLSDNFFENEENMKLLEEAALGDVDAIDKLRTAASEDILVSILLEGGYGTDSDIYQQFMTLNDDLQALLTSYDFGIDPYLDTTDFAEGTNNLIDQMNNMIIAAGWTAEQVQSYFGAMGYDVNLTTATQTIPGQHHETEHSIQWNGITISKFKDIWDEDDIVTSVPVVETISANGSSGGKINTSTYSAAKGNTKGGSSGSSKSEKNYDNPYESYYNGLKDITEEMRTRENLEKRYQLLVKRGQNNLAKTDDYYKSYVASLEKEYDLQKGIYNAAKSDIESTLKEYSDVTKYATYNWDDNTVEIDWAAIEKLDKNDNEEVGERVDELVDILNDLSDDMKDAEDSMYDLAESFEDMRQELIDSYLDFEDRVANALQKIDQDIIDEKEALYDALDSAASDLVDSVRDNVNATRQLRDNADTEEEIAKKERRLAYLRQDTSGANALEIKQLEEDLADTKQSYQDSLVDQALDTLQAQNDAAAAQRERQISLMESQVEWNEKNGVYTAQVASLLEKAMGDGVLDTKDALYDVLYKGENWDAYSETGLAEALKNANTEALKAYEGLKAADNIEDNSAFDKSSLNNADPEKDVKEPTKEEPAKTTTTTTTTSNTITWDRILSAYNNINGGKWGNGLSNRIANGKAAGYTEAEVRAGQQLIDYVYPTNLGGKGYTMAKAKQLMGYKTGGLADYTGPAWLDGTKANPELVLNATDTKNFIQLKDILSGILQGGVSGNAIGDYNFDIDINVDEIGNDYDVEQLVSKVKSELVSAMTYRNFNSVSVMR